MIQILKQDIDTYNKKGWCVVKSGLSHDELLKYKKKIQQIEINAKRMKYKMGRVYFDYINDFNLAAVEAPLNKLVCEMEVHKCFQKIKIGSAVKQIMGWNNTICPLIRLFCMNKYKYSSHWHQDNKIQNKALQASIIFNDERRLIWFKIKKL